MTETEKHYRREVFTLAAERGYHSPVLRNGHLVVYCDQQAVDYALEILEPHGLGVGHPTCTSWREAARLMGLLPPARSVEPTKDSLHPEGI